MSDGKLPDSFLRQERAEAARLTWAFVLSLILHLLFYGSYQLGNKFGIWQQIQMPHWLKSVRMLSQILQVQPVKPAPKISEPPLVFIDVSPAQAVAEPPKEAKFYSDKNSKAANPDADKDVGTPKISGEQTVIPKTVDVPREDFTRLQPAPPAPAPPKPAEEKQEESKAMTLFKPGDLIVAKPDADPKKDDGQAKETRPRLTVAEAKARQNSQLRGQKMKQEGGVGRRLELSSVDAKATAYGAYDNDLVRAIAEMWYGLLDQQMYASDYRGKVEVQFSLHFDGSISDLTIVDNTAGDVPGSLCWTAVDRPKPYNKFPTEMRHLLGDIRHIRFTFYYN